MNQPSFPGPDRRLLLAAAAPVEAAALRDTLAPGAAVPAPWRVIELTRHFDLVLTGIGKANAAAAVARALDGLRHAGVLSVGVAGALPGSGLAPGAVVLASACVFADEGVQTPEGFLDCPAMGFPFGDFPGSAVPVDPGLLHRLRPLADAVGPIATVSTCSGTDARAAEIAARTGALAEAMEGAAVVATALRLGAAAGELRAISNTTGNRAAQRWDIRKALDALGRVLGRAGAET